jgi:hypothetical protein
MTENKKGMEWNGENLFIRLLMRVIVRFDVALVLESCPAGIGNEKSYVGFFINQSELASTM